MEFNRGNRRGQGGRGRGGETRGRGGSNERGGGHGRGGYDSQRQGGGRYSEGGGSSQERGRGQGRGGYDSQRQGGGRFSEGGGPSQERGRGRGRGGYNSQRQERSDDTWSQGSGSSYSREQGGNRSWRTSQEPEGSRHNPQEQSQGRFPGGPRRGGQVRGIGQERSDHSWRSETSGPPPTDAFPSSSTWGSKIVPFTVSETTEELKTLTVEPSDKSGVESGGPSKKNHRKKKGKQEDSSSSETPSVSEGLSKSQSADKPKPSTSAQASDAGDQSSTQGASGTGVAIPVSSTYNEIPKRRKQGSITAGSKYFDHKYATKIEVNYLPIEFSNKNMKIYHYDVEFGKRMNKTISRELMKEMRRQSFPKRHPAFDGAKNLYAAKDPLFQGNSITKDIKIVFDGSEKECTVTLKKAAENVELTIGSLYDYMEKNGCTIRAPRSTIQALEIAMKGNLSDHFVSCGRAFYMEPAQRNRVALSGGLDLFSGFTQSSVLGQKPYINIDVSHRGFFKEQPLMNLLEYLMQKVNYKTDFSEFSQGLSTETLDELTSYLKQNGGLKIRYIDPQTKINQSCKIKGLGKNSKQAMFEMTEGEKVFKISVYDYFKMRKGYQIEYFNLPVIEVGTKGRLLPMECCHIESKQPVGNRYEYSPEEGRQMIANCKDLPHARKEKILRNIQDAKYNDDPVLREFGVTIGARGNTKKLLEVTAGYLRSPNILYKNGHSPVNNGVWEMGKFMETKKITDWILVNMDRGTYENNLKKLSDELVKNASAVGLQLERPTGITNYSRVDEASLEKFFMEQKSKYKGKLQLIIVILPGGHMTDLVYRRVKYVSEIKIGVLTQCARPKTVQSVSWMTAKNFLLKINSKIRGVNHIMNHPDSNDAIFDGSTMFVGADVTHPRGGKGDGNERSVCAVAGSYDKHGFQYKMLYSVQSSCEEMIQDMGRLIQALLVFFKQNNGFYPKKMFYFRDGVSDGQFAEVLNTEMSAIKLACARLKTEIKVTFLVVQKRHHTRFFPQRQDADKKGNVYAGTVVNDTITHPTEHDFYLVSHQSIQGTARPTKYHVLYDEIGEPDDYVEALTYYLCYMFCRCTRSVSYPAPTYYSHLAAARAEKYVKCIKEKMRNLREVDAQLKAGVLGEGTIHSDMRDQNPMFFV